MPTQRNETGTPPANAGTRQSRNPRRTAWLVAVVGTVTLALVGVYAATHSPGSFPMIESMALVDSDHDGLKDGVETSGWRTQDGAFFRTDPLQADTDGDGLSDGDEAGPTVGGDSADHTFAGVSDPTKADSDSDGLDDKTEVRGWRTQTGQVFRTQVMNRDSDSDGLFDGDEAGAFITSGASVGTYNNTSDPFMVDSDGDSLRDADEADLGLDALDADTDDDGAEDGTEAEFVGSDPGVADTDGDGFNDDFEYANRDTQGLDPLRVDVKVGKWDYALDFAKGAVAGELLPVDSVAWLVGNLTAGGASFVPGVGWIVGGVADIRDAVGSAIQADWVGAGFSALGLVPDIGDAAALPAKVGKFATRNPHLAPLVGAAIVAINKIPDSIKAQTVKGIWKEWEYLRQAGFSNSTLLRLQKGGMNLDALATAYRASSQIEKGNTKFINDWADGEKYLEDRFDAHVNGVSRQVRASTEGCIEVCNTSNVRIFDVVAAGIAHESKVGYKTLGEVEKQIRSDAYLIQKGVVAGAHWHFFASGQTDKLGASPEVFALLNELGIKYTIHLPK